MQERVKVRLLRGTESDILEDGALDYPDAVLEKLDVGHRQHPLAPRTWTRRR